MPSNIIKINDCAEFCVGDSKMDLLVKFLKKNGSHENKEARELTK